MAFTKEDAIAELRRRQTPNNVETPNGLGRNAAIIAKNAGVGFATAIPDTLSLVGNSPYYAANLAGYLTGNKNLQNLPAPLPYASDYINEALEKATGNYFQPQNFTEKALGTAANFAAGGKSIAKAGATELSPLIQKYFAPQNLRDYASLGGAGIGLEGAREIAPESTVAQVAGATIGALAPSSRSAITDLLRINPNKIKAFEDAGLQGTLADVSDSRFIKGVQNLNVEVPFSGNIIMDSIKKTSDTLQERLAKGLSQEEAGAVAQIGLKNYQKRGSEVAHKLQKNMAKHLAPDQAIPINKTLQAIDTQTKFSTPEAQQQFASSALGKEYEKLSTIAQRNNGTIPYQDLVYFRQNIDDQINNFGLMGFNKEQGALKNLRGQIQNDIGGVFKSTSPKAAIDFERFNKFYTQFARKNENIINGLLKDKTATQTFRSIVNDLKVDASKAETVIKTLKPQQKEIFSQSLVKELGMNPQNDFSAASFATNFKKLEPNAQEVLLAPFNLETRKQLRATVDAIDAMKETKAIANPSGTANQAFRGGAIYGAIAHPIFTGAILLGGKLNAHLMTSPSFINWLSKAPSITDPKQLAQHIGNLGRVAKASPELAPDIQRYLGSLKQEETSQPEEAAQQPNFTITKEQALQELERRKQPPSSPQSQNETQVTPQLLNKISTIESGGNPNARSSTSSASGAFQFTNATWRNAVNQYGAETGITIKDKNNPEAQRLMTKRMLTDSAPELANILGRNPNDTELYLTHFLGLGGAKKLLNSHTEQYAARILPEAAKANRSLFYNKGRPLTVEELYNAIDQKIKRA